MLHQLVGGHAVKRPVVVPVGGRRRRGREWLGGFGSRCRRTGRNEQECGKGQVTHAPLVARRGDAGKLAGPARGR